MATLALGAGCIITAGELATILGTIWIAATVVAAGLWYNGREHTLEEVRQDIKRMRGGCLKCSCENYSWNPISAANKELGIYKGGGYNADVDAYRNCKCGHHKNYHV